MADQLQTKPRRIEQGALVIAMEPDVGFRLGRTQEVEFFCTDGCEPWFEPTELPDGSLAYNLTKRRIPA